MARSDVETYLLLNAWPRLMHEDTWRFNQIGGEGVRVAASCASPTYIQYERDYIASALYDAVQRAADYFGFYPAPVWVADEVIQLKSGSDWQHQIVETRWGYLTEFGKRAITLEDGGATTVVYSDEDQDGIEETGSVTVTTSVADSELHVFFRVGDGAAGAAHELWRIEPLTVTDIGGGQKKLSGHRSLFAHPKTVWAREYAAHNFYEKHQGDTKDVTAFVTAVDVYRVYNDPAAAVTLLSDPRLSTTLTWNVNAFIQDSKYGCFTLRKVSDSDPDPTYPVAVRVSYRAGFPLTLNRTDRRLEVALVRYANTIMPEDTTFCGRTQALWQRDRDLPEAITEQEAKHPPPFGMTRGGLFAWGVRNALFLPGKAREVEMAEADDDE